MNREWFTATELAGLPGMPMTKSAVIRRGKSHDWLSRARKARGGGREYHLASLPKETQAACLVGLTGEEQPEQTPVAQPVSVSGVKPLPQASDAASYSYDRESLWGHFDQKTNSQKDKANAKLRLLLAVVAMHETGISLGDAFKAVGIANNTSWRTIQGWYHGTSGKPGVKHYDRRDWLAALVPGYVGRTATAEISEQAWEFFKADYLRLEKPTAAACYGRLKRAAKEHSWNVPALKTIERKIKSIPLAIRILKREGEQGLMRLYPAQQRTVRDMYALQWINGDGYQHNVFVKFPNGDIERPKTWFWQDIYSRKILAYRVDSTENTDQIRLSFGDLVEQYGIPEHATIDNTRAAANKWMTGGVANRYRFKVKEDDPIGLLPALGVQIHWTSVLNGKGHGQAKPIERSFGVGGIGEVVDKHPSFAGAYTGHNTTAKPENYGSKAVPVEKFLEVLQQEIVAWNAHEGRRTEVCDGCLSFDQAFNQSYEHAPIQKATDEQRRLWLLSAEAIPVQKDGTFTLDAGSAVGKGRNRYHSRDLFEYQGHKIVVRFDPQDLHDDVHAYTLDGRFITTATCIEATGFGDSEAARAFNRQRKKFIRATKIAAKAESQMDAIDIAGQLPVLETPDIPESKVVRPLRPAPELGRQNLPTTPVNEESHSALVAQFQAQEEAEIHAIDDDPRRIHAYWIRIEQRIDEGQQVSEEEREGWGIYRNSGQYHAQKELFEAFGLAADDFA